MKHDDHDNGGMSMTPGSKPDGNMNSTSMGMMMHMSFYWGKDAIIFFSGWPEKNLGMYILALFFVFLLGFAVEILSVIYPKLGTKSMISVLIQTCIYVVRMGFAYMVMLSVMSYNLGVFIVAIAGHGAGFFILKARAHAQANGCDTVTHAGVNSKV